MNLSELRWQNKPDGTYLAINAEEKSALKNLSLEDEVNKMGYMNIDINRLLAVVEAARDSYEFIGPRLQMFDRRKTEFIEIVVQKRQVLFEVLKEIEEAGLEITAKEIEFLLKQRKIVHGIDWPLINQILQRKKFGEPHIIATETPAIKGEDAKIIEVVKLDKSSKPVQLADGNVDFRNLDNILHVKENQVLVRRIPPKAGTPGIDIFGNPIPADPGEDKPLPKGKNTLIINDHSELVADGDGYLYADGGLYCVGKLYMVNGDLNYKTGNIRYKGDVYIRGSVQADFVVDADGDVTIEGSVEAATIKATGKITIKSGVFGKGKALISAGETITINQGQDATFITPQELKFSNVLSDCIIEAQSVKSYSLSAVMQGCKVKVTDCVKVAQIGSQSSNPTDITFFDPRSAEIQALIQETYGKKSILQQDLENYSRQLKTMKSILSKAEEVTPRMQEEVKKVFLLFQSTQTKIDLLDKKMANLNKSLKEATHFKVELCAKLVFPILKVQMLEASLELKDALKDVKFEWVNQEIIEKNCNYNAVLQSMRQS